MIRWWVGQLELRQEFPVGTEQAVGARVKADLAANYYEARLISLGRAAEMSGLRRGEFEELLAQRRTVLDYGADDLAADLAWANAQ